MIPVFVKSVEADIVADRTLLASGGYAPNGVVVTFGGPDIFHLRIPWARTSPDEPLPQVGDRYEFDLRRAPTVEAAS